MLFIRLRMVVNEHNICSRKFSDRTTVSRTNKDSQEITDCRSTSRKTSLSNDTSDGATRPCGGDGGGGDDKSKDVADRRTRFCIMCTLNASSSHDHRQRLNYVLQLFKTVRGTKQPAVLIAFNLTGVPVIEDNAIGRTFTDDVKRDDNDNGDNGDDDDGGGDYYSDPEQAEDVAAGGGTPAERNRDNNGNAVHRVVFVIDDTVEPGTYRGRIYNGDEGTVSAVVKGMINVATFDEFNSDDYIVDDTEDDTGRFFFFFFTIVVVRT